MSTQQLSAALGIWRGRKQRTGRDMAYVFYAFVLITIIVVAPVVRLLWLLATSPSGITLLTSTAAPGVISLITAGLWAGALLLGRSLGPTLMPPFLLHALTESSIRRSAVLRGPLIRAGLLVVAAFAGSAVFVGVALIAFAGAQLLEMAGFVIAAVAAGVITTVAWLTGQTFPRTAIIIALGILAFAALGLLLPQTTAFLPWGWVGGSFPLTGSVALPLVGITVFAVLLAVATPLLLRLLTGMQLSNQALKWERATMFSFTLEFGAATAVYETQPRFGRNLRAVRVQRQRAFTFILRDVIGQLRTPARSLCAVAATAAAGIVVVLSFLPGAPIMLLAGVAGVVVYVASGPLAQGLRHAANVAGDYPLYGISDRTLVLFHTLFPLVTVTAVLSTTAVATAFLTGAPLGIALGGAWAIGLLTLAVRLSSALKGPLPPSLLSPINTPAGDLSILMQLGWALSELPLAVLGGITVALLPNTPIPLLLLFAWVVALLVSRWRKRR